MIDTRLACRGRARPLIVWLIVLATAVSASNEALAAPLIRLPRIHISPPVELAVPAATRQQVAAARESATTYGTGITVVENQLDTVNDAAVGAIENDIRRIGLSAGVRERLRQCVTSGLSSTAESYGQAIIGAQPDFPGVYGTFQAAATGCIQDRLGIPDHTARETASYLSYRVHEYFADAADTTTSGPAHQRWLHVTAQDVAAHGRDSSPDATPDSGNATFDVDSSTSSESSLLPWLGGATLFLAVVILVWRPWRRS